MHLPGSSVTRLQSRVVDNATIIQRQENERLMRSSRAMPSTSRYLKRSNKVNDLLSNV